MYNTYIEITAMTNSIKDLSAWKGHVESKLKKLTKLFEMHKYYEKFVIHLLPNCFKLDHYTEYTYNLIFYYGISTPKPIGNLFYIPFIISIIIKEMSLRI
jgi:hypothetical protein